MLPHISRSKSNQAMKFGQLIDYNMRNIFVEKPCTKVLNSLFLFCANLRAIEIQRNQAADHLLLPNIKLF